jgi:hypothetical protein
VLVALNRPVVAGLRCSIVSVLNNEQTSVFVGADHEREVALGRWRTSVLTAKVNKVRARFIGPILLIDPIALLECCGILEVKVVYIVGEPKLLEIVIIDIREQVCIDGCCCFSKRAK